MANLTLVTPIPPQVICKGEVFAVSMHVHDDGANFHWTNAGFTPKGYITVGTVKAAARAARTGRLCIMSTPFMAHRPEPRKRSTHALRVRVSAPPSAGLPAHQAQPSAGHASLAHKPHPHWHGGHR